MASSPVSSLSTVSDDLLEDMRPSERDASFDGTNDTPAMPPSKRRRLTGTRQSPRAAGTPVSMTVAPIEAEYQSDISSDTSGSAPPSPKGFSVNMVDEFALAAELIRICQWDGCDAGDLGNNDVLVDHVDKAHVGGSKKAKFSCEWTDCKAKGKTQATAYALRAHMRSHTKEKPHYCALPECDRSFTRSDALAKHMRTVHETESMRTTEHFGKRPPQAPATVATPEATPPPPSSATEQKPPQKLKLIFNSNKNSEASTPQHNSTNETNNTQSDVDVNSVPLTPLSPASRDAFLGPFPTDTTFTSHESALPPKELYRLLRRQIHWATLESDHLQSEVSERESRRQNEWLNTELVLENVLEAEYAGAEKRGVFAPDGLDAAFNYEAEKDSKLDADADADAERINEPTEKEERAKALLRSMEEDARLASRLPLEDGDAPWYRDERMRSLGREKWRERKEQAARKGDIGWTDGNGEEVMHTTGLRLGEEGDGDTEVEGMDED